MSQEVIIKSNCLGKLKTHKNPMKDIAVAYSTRSRKKVDVTSGYQDFFYSDNNVECPINFCELLDSNCISEYTGGSNLEMERYYPWEIRAFLNVKKGIDILMCVKCYTNER